MQMLNAILKVVDSQEADKDLNWESLLNLLGAFHWHLIETVSISGAGDTIVGLRENCHLWEILTV